MKILIVTKHYLTRGGGGPNGSRAYIKALCQLYDDVTLLYPDDRDSAMPHIYGDDHVTYLPCYDDRSRLHKGIDVYLGKTHRMLPMVKEILKYQSFGIVFIDHSSIANGVLTYVRKHTKAKVVTIHHNVEYDYLHDNPFPWMFRWPMNYYCIKAERDSVLKGDLGLVLTEADRDRFVSLYHAAPERLACFGTFFYEDFQPSEFVLPNNRRLENIVITSQLTYPQNTAPLIHFLDNYYPAIKSAVPDTHLIVAGRNPTQAVHDACERHEDVELIPSPEDMGAILSRASIYLCPTDCGSGIKLRIFDGLRAGMPIIVHKNSLNGYEPLVKKGIVYPYDDTNSLLKAIKELRSRPVDPITVRTAFAEYYSFTAGKNRLKKILISEKKQTDEA